MNKVALLLLPAVFISVLAKADDQSFPYVSGELAVELQNDQTYDSDDETAEINDLYPTITLGATGHFSEEFTLNLEATLEPVEDATDDRAFSDLGGYVNILTVDYSTDQFGVYGGKFTPKFGIAWDAAPGLYGADLSEDYELAEMIGVGGSVNFKAAGAHTISASTFFVDTSFFSDSAGTSRGPVDVKDGGAANTEDFSSFALALDGRFDAIDGLRYHIGLSSLAEGQDGDEDQIGFVVGGEYEIALNEDVSIVPLVEYAMLDNAAGINKDDATYLTTGIAFGYADWFATATYQDRDVEKSGVETDDHVFDVSVGYGFGFGLETSIGYRLAEEDNIDSKGFGLFAGYVVEF